MPAAAAQQQDIEIMDVDDLLAHESGGNNEERKGEEAQSRPQNNSNTLELDSVNRHESMKNIKRCLDRMQELFAGDWKEAGYDDLPQFMQALKRDAESPDAHLNVKIFILKLLVNNSQLFKPFAQHWFHVICEFMVARKTGGKGFHYFLRDLATLLIQWSDTFTPRFENARERTLCSQVMNKLINITADKSKYIFNINIEIVAALMEKWRDVVALDKVRLGKMLSIDEKQEGSHLWKMNAI